MPSERPDEMTADNPTPRIHRNLADLYADSDRAERVAEIARLIEEKRVKHVYFQYVTMQGRVMAKVIPGTFWAQAATKGLTWPYTISGGLHATREGEVMGEGGGTTLEGLILPDLTTFDIFPWADGSMARVFCTNYRRLDEEERPGEIATQDVRALLAVTLEDFYDATRVIPRSGCEPEMSWFKSRDQIDTSSSLYPSWVSPGYSVRHLESMRPVLQKVTDYGSRMGFEMIQADYEDPNQLEANFQFDGFMKTADRVITYRQICMQVADELGMVATFMPKPISGIMANGLHHHVSFWRDGENLFVDPSKKSRANLTDEGRHAIGGILNHSRGMQALVGPTVNSYKRFLDANWSPTDVSWGYDNRLCSIRALDGRFEVRMPDSSANPYLSHLAILTAIRDGWENKTDPGPNRLGEGPADAAYPKLPVTLAEALDAFEEDEVISGMLPPDLRDLFVTAKRDEWMRFCGAITDWDFATYLNYTP